MSIQQCEIQRLSSTCSTGITAGVNCTGIHAFVKCCLEIFQKVTSVIMIIDLEHNIARNCDGVCTGLIEYSSKRPLPTFGSSSIEKGGVIFSGAYDIYVCLYVCFYVCMYVCMYVCTCMYMYVCMYVCMYVYDICVCCCISQLR